MWYLRLLLYHTAASSFDALRGGYSSFQEAAKAAGHLPESQEAVLVLTDAMHFEDAPKRRSLFVQLTLESFPTLHIFNGHPVLKRSLMEDYLIELRHGSLVDNEAVLKLAEKKLVKCVATMLQYFGRTPEQYGFPVPDEALETELEAHKRQQNCERERLKLLSLHAAAPNNARQGELYRMLTNCIDEGTTKLVFLQGQGGSGKTTFAKKISAYAKSKGHVVLGCASTGLACQVYDEGQFVTAHSLFGIPVFESVDDYDDEESAFTSKLMLQPTKLELLHSARVIIWDEILSNDKHCFESAFRVCNEFQGKLLLAMGDCRQIGPVVKYGGMLETIGASLINSLHWPKFTVFELVENMRLTALRSSTVAAAVYNRESAFAANLLIIGNGEHDVVHAQLVS